MKRFNVPRCTPLETPLTPPRKRRSERLKQRSVPRTTPDDVTPSPPALPASSGLEVNANPERPPSLSTLEKPSKSEAFDTLELPSSPAMLPTSSESECIATSQRPSSPLKFSCFGCRFPFYLSSKSLNERRLRPSMCVDDDVGTSPPLRKTAIRIRDMSELMTLHYGSDPESGESEDDGDYIPMVIPRSMLTLIDAPYDEDLDPTDVVCDSESEGGNGLHYGPLNMYNFDWRPFPDIPFDPQTRRENFLVTDCGPTVSAVDPYDIFTLIWDRPFMELIASETNRYALQLTQCMINEGKLGPRSRICDWRDTDADELYIFFSVLLAMCVILKTKIEEYWDSSDDIFCTPGFRYCMSLRRFQILCQCLHFSNSEDMQGFNLDVEEAKLYKIQPVLTHLNEKFSSMYVMNQNIALDESLLQWRNILNILHKEYKGMKIFAICESETGYLWRFKVHTCNKIPTSFNQSDPMTGTTPNLVLNLIEGLEHKGYTLFMDNYYNSPVLARKLKSIGFDCVGSLRLNQQLIPRELADAQKENMRPGQMMAATSGDVDIIVWRDSDLVVTFSTYHGNGVSTEKGVTKPNVVRDYNNCMGGVDRKDRMLATFPIERTRTDVWYKKLFRHLLNISVLNAYIIHQKSSVSGPKLGHRDFRENLLTSLIKNHLTKPFVIPPTTVSTVARGSTIISARDHYPQKYPLLPSAENKSQRRRQCTICRKRTHIYCVGCNKPVCLTTCFRDLHIQLGKEKQMKKTEAKMMKRP